MSELLRTDSTHPDFIALVQQLDRGLAITDGEDHAFYHQFYQLDKIKHAIVLYDDGQAVACGAIRGLDQDHTEIKRMFTLPASRGKGMATRVLNELETWARELGFKACRLETGIRQPEAIALYTKQGYHRIPNYGQYAEMEASVCFEKRL